LHVTERYWSAISHRTIFLRTTTWQEIVLKINKERLSPFTPVKK